MGMTLRTASLVVLFAASCAAGAPAAQPRNLAVVIGVQDYMFDLPDLNYCVNDATGMATVLEERCGYKSSDIKILYTGGKPSFSPSKQNVEAALQHVLIKEAGVLDTVLVYFTGHGLIDQDESKTAYLATVECDRENLAETSIAMKDVTELMNRCKAQRKFLILDCCHAAAIHGAKDAKGNEFTRPLPEIFKNAKGFATLASCLAEETSREYDEMKRGLFTHFLIQGLQGAADQNSDGVIVINELNSYVYDNVSQTALRKMGGHRQSPTLHLAGTTGTLALATYQRAAEPLPNAIVRPEFRHFPTPILPDDIAKRNPRLPVDEANQAFKRLLAGDPKSVDDPDIKLLIDVAESLRTPDTSFVDPQGEPLNLANPYFELARSNHVYDWLRLAKTNYEKAEKELPRSLRISLALAAWYNEKPDPALAREMIDGLGTTEDIEKLPGVEPVKAQLLLVKAHTRNRIEEKPAALRTYLRVLEQVKENERVNKRLPQWNVISDAVLEPARFTTLDLASKAGDLPNQRDIARTYGEYADLIRRSQVMTESQRGIEYYEKAIRLDPDEPSYKIGQIALKLFSCAQSTVPNGALKDYSHDDAAKELSDLEKSVTTAGDAGALGLLYGTRGLALHEHSRTALRSARVGMLRSAIEDYSKSIKAYEQLASQSKLRIRDQLEYALAYQNRGVAQVELANLGTFDHRNPQQRMEVLEKAAADGRKARELDPNRGHECYLTVGNAYEDLAWLPGGNKAFYRNAQKMFEDAVDKFPMQAKCYASLGRCLYKQGNSTDAEMRLSHSLALSKSPEAHYFLGRIMLDRGQVLQGLEQLTAAVEMYDRDVVGICLEAGENLRNKQNKLEILRLSAASALKLLDRRANGAKVLTGEPESRELIDRLITDAERLGKLNRIDRVIVQAETHRITAALRSREAREAGPAQSEQLRKEAAAEIDRGLQKLKAAKDVLNAPEAGTDTVDQVRLLVECVTYCVRTPSLFQQEAVLLKAIDDGRDAVRVGVSLVSSHETTLLLAQARGWTGTAMFLHSWGKNPQTAAKWQDEAEPLLRNALEGLQDGSLTDSEKSDAWRWAQGLGLLNQQRYRRVTRGTPEYKTLWNKSYDYFKLAHSLCEIPAEKAEIQRQWNDVYRQR